jgi:hypothetical protein
LGRIGEVRPFPDPNVLLYESMLWVMTFFDKDSVPICPWGDVVLKMRDENVDRCPLMPRPVDAGDGGASKRDDGGTEKAFCWNAPKDNEAALNGCCSGWGEDGSDGVGECELG